MKIYTITLIFVSLSLSGFSQVLTMGKISDNNQFAGPAVAINRKDIGNVVVLTSPGTIFSSIDSAKNWRVVSLKVYSKEFGTPMLISDKKGRFYYSNITEAEIEGQTKRTFISRISITKGFSWEEGEIMNYASGVPYRNWSVYDINTDNIYTSWTNFDKYRSESPEDKSNIYFNTLTKSGKKWSDPKTITVESGDCMDSNSTVMGAIPAVDVIGRIFVVFANNNNLYIDRSFDKGDTWLRKDIHAGEQKGGWDIEIPGVKRGHGLPAFAMDNSGSVLSGTLYVFWSQKETDGTSKLVFKKSQRNGDTWTQPEKIFDQDTVIHQFFPIAKVDDFNGILYLIYYSMNPDKTVDVILNYSLDGGNTFNRKTLNEKPFSIKGGPIMSNYLALDAYKGFIATSWVEQSDDGGMEVKGSFFKYESLVK
ncbi:MAG: glycoside hydrolase [Cyclobacteriaceae bacterium]|nr:glycoside hydrolase [Cyclobacteriaceae bacterium]